MGQINAGRFISSTGIEFPSYTESQKPTNLGTGATIYNSSTEKLETWNVVHTMKNALIIDYINNSKSGMNIDTFLKGGGILSGGGYNFDGYNVLSFIVYGLYPGIIFNPLYIASL